MGRILVEPTLRLATPGQRASFRLRSQAEGDRRLAIVPGPGTEGFTVERSDEPGRTQLTIEVPRSTGMA